MRCRPAVFSLVVSAALLLSTSSVFAQAPAVVDLQALVKQLQEQIKTLQSQVQELKTQLAVTKEEAADTKKEVAATKQEVAEVKQELQLTRSLQRGVRGDDVRKLQEFLSQFSDIYPQGLTTGFYGPATEAAVRKLQARHGIEQVGIIGPKTLSKINELISEGAGKSGVIPPGLLRAPGIERGLSATASPASGIAPPISPGGAVVASAATSTLAAGVATTSPAALCAADAKYCATRDACVASGFYWYTVSCHRTPPALNSCAASYNYCISPTECSAQGWYSCRGSCYPSVDACQGETYVPPATPAPVPAIPATPAQAIGQTGTTTVAASAAVLAITGTTTASTATTTTTATTTVSTPVFRMTAPNGGEQWAAGNSYTIAWTSTGVSPATISIDLYKSGVYHSSIAANAVNTGSISWTVPASIASGSDYAIRVYTSATFNNFDESDGPINIGVPVIAPGAPPIGYWKFDGSGANEIVGGPGVVTVGSAVFRSSGGKFGGYLYIPSSGDYAKIPYRSMFDLQNFTVEFYFRQRANQGFNQNLIYKGTPVNNYNFNIFRYLWNQFNNGAVIAGSTAAGTGYWHQVSNNNEPPHNAWHHVVYTKTIEGAAYYIDGVLIHSRNYTADRSPEYAGPVKTPATDIIIGSPAPDTDMDNLRIYNYALSRGEVLYNLSNIPGVAPPPADTAPPTISNVQATQITASSTVITWTTDEQADSQVEYGAMTSYGLETALDINRITSHSALLSGLTVSTAYHYRVKSKDAAGNPATSADQTFTTAAPAVSCVGPYHVLASDGRCVWSCGTGTTPSNTSNECVCQSGYTESGTDQFSRRVCSQPAIPQVQGLTATVSGTSVALVWQAVSGISLYNIHRGTSADFIPVLNVNHIAQGNVLSYTDANLAVGTYYYKVVAQDASGNVGSASTAASAQIVSPVYALMIRGRLANAITKEPAANSNLYLWNWKGSVRRDFPLQPDGSFVINVTADDLANASATYVNAVHNSSKACYDQSSFTIRKTVSGGVDYIHVQETAGDHQTTRQVKPVGTDADIGDLLAWPVTGFSLTSDIAVKFSGTYANGRSGGGNINYRTSHGFSTFVPVNISMAITLTDQAGAQYVSPYATYGLSQQCNQVSLSFANGQFTWNPPGTLSVADRQSSFAAIQESLNRIRAALEKLRGY